ncbi:MAG: hypothetical protein AB8B87_18115 [Granulosicoccus sp.]
MIPFRPVDDYPSTFSAAILRSRLCSTAIFICLMLCILPATARTYSVVVTGLGGNTEYSEAFSASSEVFNSALSSLESDASLIVSLDETSTRETILEAIAQQAARMQSDLAAGADDAMQEPTFVLIMTGHGNADTNGWRFNVTGPDISSDDLIAALNTVPTATQLVVLAASASGAALDTMSQLGRVLVTATKSGGEINAIRFHNFLSEAMKSDVADYDRNEILTIAEAYRFAEARTVEYYEQQNLLASEHSRIRGENADDVAVALLGSLRDAKDDPLVATLLEERLGLEQTFKALRQRKPDMPVETYYRELEVLLLSIARLQQSIDEATGWSDGDANS